MRRPMSDTRSSSLNQLPAVIKAVAPLANAALWSNVLAAPMRSSGITTPRRIAMFVGQCAEESGGFTSMWESLYYRTPERLCVVWKRRFPTIASAKPYICDPHALANYVYANRLGNGDETSGDAWTFRGRGLIQLTGRLLYTDFAHAVGRDPDTVAEWVATPEGAAMSACWYWSWAYHGALNALADAWDIENVTLRINGALGNIDARTTACEAALRVFGAAPVPAVKPMPAAPELTADDLNARVLASLHPETVT
jgi:putative chitinase